MNQKIVLALILLFIIGCTKTEMVNGNVKIKIKTLGNTTEEGYNQVRISIYDLLAKNHSIKLNYGNFLLCIDNVCSNREMAWVIYVNSDRINYGVKNYIVKDDDYIELAYE